MEIGEAYGHREDPGHLLVITRKHVLGADWEAIQVRVGPRYCTHMTVLVTQAQLESGYRRLVPEPPPPKPPKRCLVCGLELNRHYSGAPAMKPGERCVCF